MFAIKYERSFIFKYLEIIPTRFEDHEPVKMAVIQALCYKTFNHEGFMSDPDHEATMARRTKEEALETRNRLLDTAEHVFLKKGFCHTSLNDIAQESGLTRGAVYWHFKNKSDLFEALVERVRLPAEALGDCSTMETDPDPLGRLREFAVLMLKETVTNQRRRRVFTILFHRFEHSCDSAGLELRQRAAYMDCIHRVEQALRCAVAKGQLPGELNVNKSAIAYQAFFTGLLASWLFMPRSFALHEEAEAMVDSFFSMLQHSPAMRQPSMVRDGEAQDAET